MKLFIVLFSIIFSLSTLACPTEPYIMNVVCNGDRVDLGRHTSGFEWSVRKGRLPAKPHILETLDEKGNSTLMVSMIHNNYITMGALLEKLEESESNIDLKAINDSNQDILDVAITYLPDHVPNWRRPRICGNGGPLPGICSKYQPLLPKKDILEMIRKAMEGSINIQDTDGNNSLMRAIISRNVDEAKRILLTTTNAHPLNINLQNKNGDTALHLAINHLGSRHIALIRLILALNPKTNLINKKGQNPLLMLYKDPVLRPLFNKLLLSNPIDINLPDEHGMNLLMWSITLDDFDSSRLFIKSGIDLTHKDKFGYNSLMYAIKESRPEVFDLILRRAAHHNTNLNIESKNNNGLTAFLLAAKTPFNKEGYTNYFFLEALLNFGADIDSLDSNKENALFYVIKNIEIEKIEYLIQEEINIEQKNVSEETPLAIAIKETIEEVVSLLLKERANVNTIDINGDIPLMYVWHSPTILRNLLRRGSKINHQNNLGETPLMKLVERNDLSAIKYISSRYQINYRQKNSFGQTARDIANELKLDDIADHLRKCIHWGCMQ